MAFKKYSTGVTKNTAGLPRINVRGLSNKKKSKRRKRK